MAANWFHSLFPRPTSRKSRRAGRAPLARPKMTELEDRSTPAAFSIAFQANPAVSESNNPNTSITLVLTTVGNAPLANDLTVRIQQVGGTAGGTDFVPFATTTKTFLAGKSTGETQSATVTILDDVRIESFNESIGFMFDTIMSGAGDTNNGASSGTGSVLIEDDDSAVVTLSDAASVTEGSMTSGSLKATLTLNANFLGAPLPGAGALDVPITVNVVNDDDFSPVTAQVFPAVATSVSGSMVMIPVTADDDLLVEPTTEMRTAVPTATSAATVTTMGTGTVTVTENDSATVMLVPATTAAVAEQGTTSANLSVSLVLNATGTGVVAMLDTPITNINITVPDTLDYTVTATGSFAQGAVAGALTTIAVMADQDDLIEQILETNSVTLSAPTSLATVGVSGTGAVTISDNDTATITLSGTADTDENGLNDDLTVMLSLTANGVAGTGTLATPITNIAIANAPDYTVMTPGSFAVNAVDGATTMIIVMAVNDALVEAAQSFDSLMLLTPTTLASVTKAGTGTVNVADNDSAVVFTGPGSLTVTEGLSTTFMGLVGLAITANGTGTPAIENAITVNLTPGPGVDNDYAVAPLIIPAMSPAGAFPLTISGVDDTLVEVQNEAVVGARKVTVTDPGGVTVMDPVGANVMADVNTFDLAITVMDNDFAQVFTGPGTLTVTEGMAKTFTGLVGLVITANGITGVASMGSLAVPVTVNLTPGPGTDNDYAVTPLVIPIGSVTSGLTFDLTFSGLDDNLVELTNETAAGGPRKVTVTSPGPTAGGPNVTAASGTGDLTVVVTDADSAMVSIAPATITMVTEGLTANVVVTLAFAPGADTLAVPVTVDLIPGPGLPAEYTTTAKTLAIGSMAGGYNLVVTGIDDRRVEGTDPSGVQTLAFTSPPGAKVSVTGGGSTTIQVLDNDRAELQFVTAAASQTEPNAPTNPMVPVGVQLQLFTTGTGPEGIDKEIKATVTNATAGPQPMLGVDYTLTSPGVTFAVGTNADAMSRIINTTATSVTVIGDNKVEADEVVNLSLALALNGDGTNGKVTPVGTAYALTIVNDDAATITVSDATIGEGGALSFTVSLSNPVDVDVSVTFTTSFGTAGSADFTAVGKTVTFPANNNAPIIVLVNSVDDRRVEGTETFGVTLSALTVVPSRPVTITDTTGVGTITDNDSATLSFDATTKMVSENNTGKIAVGLTLAITAVGTGTVGIDRNIDAGLAVSGTAGLEGASTLPDYLYTPLPTPTFAAGRDADGSNKITGAAFIEVLEGLSNELNETVVLSINLADDSGDRVMVVGGKVYTFTILNDDNPVRTYDATVSGNYKLIRAGNNVQLYRDNTLLAEDPLGTAEILINGTDGITGGDGNDTLTIDLSAGNPIPAGGVTFNGGPQTGVDTLIVSGGNFVNISDNFATAADGTLLTDLGNIRYINVESTKLEVTSLQNLTLNLPASATGVHTLQDNPLNTNQGKLTVTTPAASNTTFTKPTNSLTVNREANTTTDKLTVGPLSLAATFTVGSPGKSFDTITQAAPVATSKDLAYYGKTIAINGPLTAANATLVADVAATQAAPIATGTLALGGAGNLGDYTLVNGGNNVATLVVPQARNVAYADANDLTLAPITTTAALNVMLPGTLTVAGGAVVQSQTGPVTLNATAGITVAAAAAVRALGGSQTLVTGGGLTLANGAAVQATGGGLTANAGGAIDVGPAATVQGNGAALTAAALTVGAGANVLAPAGNIGVTAGGSVVVAGGTVQSSAGAVTINAGSLTANGATLRAGAGFAAGIGGNLDIGAGTTVQAAGVTFTAGGTISVASDANVTAATGNIGLTAGNKVTVASGGTLQSTIGGITLNTANDLIAPGAVLRAGGTIAIAIDTANTDPGTGATVNLNAATIVAVNTTITGNADNDTFLVTGYTTPVMIDGKDPTGTPTGDTLVFDAQNKGVESGPNSFSTAGAPVSYVNIESVSIINVGGATGFTLNGTNGDDRLTVRNTKDGPLQYQFDGQVAVTIAPVAKFTFNGLAGRDTLIADFVNGSPIPTGGIFFDGGDDADFGLQILGAAGKATTATVMPTGTARGGVVNVDGGNISFSNLEATSQVDITNLPNVNLNLTTADPAIDINTGFDNTTIARTTPALVVGGNSIPRIGLYNNTNVNLTTAANGGADAVSISRGDNAHANQNLTITAGDDVVTGKGPLEVSGNLRIVARDTVLQNGANLTATTVELNNSASLTTGAVTIKAQTFAQTGTGAVTLAGATRVEASAATGDTVTFSGTVDGPGNLNVVNTGTTVFNQAVGGKTAVGILETNGGGRTQINGGLVNTSSRQSYGDAVGFSKSTTLSATGGVIDFASTLDPDAEGFDLTIGGPNVDITVAAGVGTTRRTGTLTVSNANNATFNGPIATTTKLAQTTGTGTTTFNGPVATPALTIGSVNVLAFNGTVDAGAVTVSNANNLTFGSTLNAGAVAIATAGNVTFNGTVAVDRIVQSAGTGTTTVNGKLTAAAAEAVQNRTTGGAVNIRTTNVVLNADVTAAAGAVVISLQGGRATQTAGALSTTKLYLNEAGDFVLNRAGNNLSAGAGGELFVNLDRGTIDVRDNSDLFLAFEDPSRPTRPALRIGGTGQATLTTPGNFSAIDLTSSTKSDNAVDLVKLIDVGTDGTVQVNFGFAAAADVTYKVDFVAEARAKLITFGRLESDSQPELANRGKDTFHVRPTLDAVLIVNGNLPNGSESNLRPFDTLSPEFVGIPIASLVPAGTGNGTYTFGSGFKSLMFTGIETLGGFSLEAFAVQTPAAAGSQNPNSYAVRGLFTQLNNKFGGSISGTGLVTNPFVVTPTAGSSTTSFRPPSIAGAFVDDDLIPDLIIGNGAGEAPLITIISGKAFLNGQIDLSALTGDQILAQFYAYEETFRGGVNVAAGDLDNDGQVEVVIGSGVGGGPRVSGFTIDMKTPGLNVFNRARLSFDYFAYEQSFRGGVNVAVGDVNADGKADLIAGSGVGGGPRVRVFGQGQEGQVLADFFAYESTARGGVLVSSGRYNADAADDVLTAPAFIGQPRLRVFLGGPVMGSGQGYLFDTAADPTTFSRSKSFVDDFAFTEEKSIISSNNSFVQGTGAIAFGSSQDGSGGNRTILVSRPRGAKFEVVRFKHEAESGTLSKVGDPVFAKFLETADAELNFNQLRGGGTVGGATTEVN